MHIVDIIDNAIICWPRTHSSYRMIVFAIGTLTLNVDIRQLFVLRRVILLACMKIQIVLLIQLKIECETRNFFIIVHVHRNSVHAQRYLKKMYMKLTFLQDDEEWKTRVDFWSLLQANCKPSVGQDRGVFDCASIDRHKYWRYYGNMHSPLIVKDHFRRTDTTTNPQSELEKK